MTKPKDVYDEAVAVLQEIGQDPVHAEAHGAELAEAVAHLREAHAEVPPSLAALVERLTHTGRAAEAQAGEDDDDSFDNMPV